MAYAKTEWSKGNLITATKLNKIENELVSLDNATTESSNKITELNGNVESLNTKVTQNETDISELKNSNSEMSTKVAQNENDISDLKTSTSEMSTSVQELQTKAQELQTKTNGNAESITGINTKISTMETTISSNKSTISELGATTSSLKTSLDALAASVGSKESMDDINISSLYEAIYPLQASINSLKSKVEWLDKVTRLQITEEIVVTEDTPSNISQPEDELVISSEVPIKAPTSVIAKTVAVENITVESTKLSLTTTGDVFVNGVSTSGNLERGSGANQGNASNSINTKEGSVTITNSKFEQNGYNCIEIGLANNSAPESVTIDGVDFGETSNNTILIFNTADNAVINISNCYVKKTSNFVRISNRDNRNITVNITNCKIDAWETTPEYAGLIMFQDYTSSTPELAQENNLFSYDKIKVNIINCYGPNGKITSGNLEEMIGSGIEDKQIAYVYTKEGVVPYKNNESRYPTFIIS